MRLFIADRIGTGAKNDAFRPDVDPAGARLGSRLLSDGTFLCVAPEADVAPVGTIDLGDDPSSAEVCELVGHTPTIVGGVTLCGS